VSEHFNLTVGMELAVPGDEDGPVCVVDKIWLYKNYDTSPSGTKVTVGMRVLRPGRMARIAEAWAKGEELHVLFSGRPSIIVVDSFTYGFGSDSDCTNRIKMVLRVYPDERPKPPPQIETKLPLIAMEDDILDAEIIK
jgi:hypothetical protein